VAVLDKMNYGWIYPDGTIKEVNIFEHSEIFNDPYALTFVEFDSREEVEAWSKKEWAQIVDDYSSRLEPDEHPAWHRLGSNDLIPNLLYDKGFARFGTYIDKFGEKQLEVSCRIVPKENVLRDLMVMTSSLECVCRSMGPYPRNKILKRIK
jgi:hypothetical protein